MISILMPFQNAELWVNETIDSILLQTHSNWEIIAVNDHSEDASEHLIQAYNDKRIQVIHNDGKGIIDALKTALKNAKGTYITRMDADDIMPKDRLNSFLTAIENAAPKTVVTGLVQYFSSEPVSDGYQKYQTWLNGLCESQDHFNHIYRECVIASPNWICRKTELDAYNLFNNLDYPEDYDLVFAWYRNQFNVKALNEVTLLWREHRFRTSRNSSNYKQPAFFKLKLRRFLEIDYSTGDRILLVGRGQKMKLCTDFFKAQNIYVQTLQDKAEFEQIHFPSLNCSKLLIAFYPDKEIDRLNHLIAAGGFELGKNAWLL